MIPRNSNAGWRHPRYMRWHSIGLRRGLDRFVRRIMSSRTLITCILVFILLWLFVDIDSYVLWWLWWCISGSPSVDDALIYGCDKSPDYSLRFAVVIPLIASQAPRLRMSMQRWKNQDGIPCLHSASTLRRPDLVFYFDRPFENAETARAIAEMKQFNAEPSMASILSSCFTNISFTTAALTASESHNTNWLDPLRNLASTRGSNAQFWRAFTVHAAYRHMFYMEPDTWPVRAGWLAQVDALTRDPSLWMRGTLMRYQPRFIIAPEPFRSQYTWHINGNAVYEIRSSCFARYRELVRATYGDAAYDVALAMYRQTRRNYALSHTVAPRFGFTNVIIDLGIERISSMQSLRGTFPETYLVHAKHEYITRSSLVT